MFKRLKMSKECMYYSLPASCSILHVDVQREALGWQCAPPPTLRIMYAQLSYSKYNVLFTQISLSQGKCGKGYPIILSFLFGKKMGILRSLSF